ncbi:MAG TPA: MAPEG family protein [Gammaproteobacteria bacterium]
MIYPMFAMVLLTFTVMTLMGVSRINSVRTGKISIGYFRIMSGDSPEYLLKLSRHFSNLFEVPVLFYTAGLLSVALNIEHVLLPIFAWLFVLLRCIHAFIHITYNNVIHRMLAFIAGSLCVLIIWFIVIFKL